MCVCVCVCVCVSACMFVCLSMLCIHHYKFYTLIFTFWNLNMYKKTYIMHTNEFLHTDTYFTKAVHALCKGIHDSYKKMHT